MTDIIKEFNMIDLLGMLLPGALVTALLGTEFGFWLWLEASLGIEVTAGIVSVILIIAGFIVGTLLHELGDVLEDLLWSAPLLNPKVYAAIASGYADYFVELDPEKKKHLRPLGNPRRKSVTLRGAGAVVLAVWAAGVTIWGNSSAALGVALAMAGAVYFCGDQIFDKLVCTRMRLGQLSEQRTCLRQLAACDRFLSYDSAAEGADDQKHLEAVMRKRDLFEGFKAMARNLLLVFLGLALYGVWSEGLIRSIRSFALDGPIRMGMSVLVLVLLAVRYYHYSYLKFKYSYEDRLQIEQEEPATPLPHLVDLTIHCHNS